MLRVRPYASVTFRDETGSGATMRVSMQEAEAAPALAATRSLVAALAGASTAAITSWSVTYPAQWAPTLQEAMPAHSDGLMVFGTADPEQLCAINLISVREALFIENEINQAAPEVQAIIGLLLNNIWQNPFGNQLTSYISGIRQERE